MVFQRISLTVDHNILRKCYRKIGFIFGNDSARFTMDQRDRRTPVALTADSPVFETEIDHFTAQFFVFEMIHNRGFSGDVIQTVELSAITEYSRFGIGTP